MGSLQRRRSIANFMGAQLFPPEKFQDIDMVEKTQTFYKKYYGYALSKENAQQILKGLSPLK